jgi:hypothetical protein
MRFTVTIRGNQYFVIDTRNRLIAAGPFSDRYRAQAAADQLERSH